MMYLVGSAADEVRCQMPRQLDEQIAALPPDEKARILQMVARDLGGVGGIETDPDVCGGEARIVRTRIPVWTLQRLRELGVSEGGILDSYPTLRAEDLVNAWAYVQSHREEIAAQIRDHEDAE